MYAVHSLRHTQLHKSVIVDHILGSPCIFPFSLKLITATVIKTSGSHNMHGMADCLGLSYKVNDLKWLEGMYHPKPRMC